MSGQLSIGQLVAFQSLTTSFLLPVISLVSLGETLQVLEGDLNRLDDVLSNPVAMEPGPGDHGAGMAVRLQGRLEFRNVIVRLQPGHAAADRGSLVHAGAGTAHRAGRRQRVGQVDHRQAGGGPVPADRRRDPVRRRAGQPDPARGDGALAGDGGAGHSAVRRDGARQPDAVGCVDARGERRAGLRGRADRRRDPRHAGWLPQFAAGRRGQPQRRPAAAAGDRARAGLPSFDTDYGRGHQRTGRRDRAADRPQHPPTRLQLHYRGAPAEHDPRLRRNHRPRPGQSGAARHAHRRWSARAATICGCWPTIRRQRARRARRERHTGERNPAEGMELWDNQPLWLDDAGTAWKVESGALGVFATTRGATAHGAAARGDISRSAPREPAEERGAGSATGARHFLFAVAPGEIVPPMPAPAGEWQLMALSLEQSRIRPLPFPPRSPDVKLALAIGQWLERLGHAAGAGLPAGTLDFQPWPEESCGAGAGPADTGLLRGMGGGGGAQGRRRPAPVRGTAAGGRGAGHTRPGTSGRRRSSHRDTGTHSAGGLAPAGGFAGYWARSGHHCAPGRGGRKPALPALGDRPALGLPHADGGPERDVVGGGERSAAGLSEGRQPARGAAAGASANRLGLPRYELSIRPTAAASASTPETAFALEPRGYVLYRSFPQDRRTAALFRFALRNSAHDLRLSRSAGWRRWRSAWSHRRRPRC